MRNILAALFVCVSIGSVNAAEKADVCQKAITDSLEISKGLKQLKADAAGAKSEIEKGAQFLGGEAGEAYRRVNSIFIDIQVNAADAYLEEVNKALPILLECAQQ